MVDYIPSTVIFEVWDEGKGAIIVELNLAVIIHGAQWSIQWFIDSATWPERNNHLQSFWGGHFVSPVLACVSRPSVYLAC